MEKSENLDRQQRKSGEINSVSSGLWGFRKHNVKLIGKLEVKVDGANEFCELIDSFAFGPGAWDELDIKMISKVFRGILKTFSF